MAIPKPDTFHYRVKLSPGDGGMGGVAEILAPATPPMLMGESPQVALDGDGVRLTKPTRGLGQIVRQWFSRSPASHVVSAPPDLLRITRQDDLIEVWLDIDGSTGTAVFRGGEFLWGSGGIDRLSGMAGFAATPTQHGLAVRSGEERHVFTQASETTLGSLRIEITRLAPHPAPPSCTPSFATVVRIDQP